MNLIFSNTLRELRKSKEMSANQLSEIFNCSKSLIYEWEKGRSQPSLEDLVKIANFFEVSLDYLLGREDDFGSIIITNGNNTLTQQQNEVIENFESLSPLGKEAILLSIKALKETKK